VRASAPVLLALATLAAGCAEGGTSPTPATERARRRAYDGAPPVIPHPPQGSPCSVCHGRTAKEVPGLGLAPPSPHEETEGIGATAHCRQCHVFRGTGGVLVESSFAGLRQDLRHGPRHHPLAPPVIPHAVFMRENCSACHCGPAAREEIRCTHPERRLCRQCHVPSRAPGTFRRP